MTGGREADLFRATADGLVQGETTTHVLGSGSPAAAVPSLRAPEVTHVAGATRIAAGVGITVPRTPSVGTAAAVLAGTWPGQGTALLLAVRHAA